MHRLARLFLAALLLVVGLAACGGSPAAAPPAPTDAPLATASSNPPSDLPPDTGAPAKQADCPRLESALYGLTSAADPAATAQQIGLTVEQDGRVQVLIELASGDAAPLAAYGATVTGQTGSLAQAFVPIDQLCALSNDAAVLMVRVPTLPDY